MLTFQIALRYLLAQKSHQAINVITWVALCGVAVITAAMLCLMSVYNGFEDLMTTLTSRFDPDIRVEASHGKVFADSDSLRQWLLADPEVTTVCATVEETVLLSSGVCQLPAKMKGVEPVFAEVTAINSILLGRDGFLLKDEEADYCIVGAGLATRMGIGRGPIRALTAYLPRREGAIDLLHPEEAFEEVSFYPSNAFMVGQADIDNEYFLCSLPLARQLMGGDSLLTTAYEVRLQAGADAARVKHRLQQSLAAQGRGDTLSLLTQHEQQASAYRVVQIERWITFVLIFLILLVASFNAISALTMLIIDKQQQITTLRHLGASQTFIRQVFTYEGWLITGLGALLGLVIGTALCLGQEHYGWITLGGGDTSRYIISAYPVSLRPLDLLIVFAATAVVGWLTTAYTLHTVWGRTKEE